MLMPSNWSSTSMLSSALLILMTIAALPELLREKRNLRRASLTSCGISTVALSYQNGQTCYRELGTVAMMPTMVVLDKIFRGKL